MPRVSFHRLAERELNDAALYYERESRGLGTIFLNDVEHYIEAIVRNPNAGVKIRWSDSSSAASPFSIRNPLFRTRRQHPNTRDHEPETQTYVLGEPILKLV